MALLAFGIVLMVAEAVTPAFGVFGTGGLASFVIGSAMLIDTDAPAYQQPNAMQLRYFTALNDVSVNQATTIVFSLPMDLLALLAPSFGGEQESA